MKNNKEIIKARNLSVHFKRNNKLYKAVDGVDFTINEGEIVAVVGESGSGKTTLGRSLIALENHATGSVLLNNKKVPSKAVEHITKHNKWIYKEAQMIYQNPVTSLNEVKKIKDILSEGIKNFKIFEKETDDKIDKLVLKLNKIDQELVDLEKPWEALENKINKEVAEKLENLKREKMESNSFLFEQNILIKAIEKLRGKILDEKNLFEKTSEISRKYKLILRDERKTKISLILEEAKEQQFDIKISLKEIIEEIATSNKKPKNTYSFKHTNKWVNNALDSRIKSFESKIVQANNVKNNLSKPSSSKETIYKKIQNQNKIETIKRELKILDEILKIYKNAKIEIQKNSDNINNENVNEYYRYLIELNKSATSAIVALENWKFEQGIREEKEIHKIIKFETDSKIYDNEKILKQKLAKINLKKQNEILNDIEESLKLEALKLEKKANLKLASNARKVDIAPIDEKLYIKRDKLIDEIKELEKAKKSKVKKNEFIENKVKLILNKVGLSEDSLDKYPSQFSGGQRQRIGIARSILVNPNFIVADEPISALDVSLQASVVNLLKDLQKEFKMAIMFIAHDLEMAKYISDRMVVMYKGKIIETGPTSLVYNKPIHPYTKALINAQPNIKKPGQKLRLAEYNYENHGYNEYHLIKEYEARKNQWVYGTKEEIREWTKLSNNKKK